MTVEQRRWVEGITNQLKNEIEKRWPLSDADWEKVTVTISEVVEKAKGNAEVRSALFDLVEIYDKTARMEKKGQLYLENE